MDNLKDKFEWVMDGFSFSTAKIVMDRLGWEWLGEIPSVLKMKRACRDMFEIMMQNNLDNISTGGFYLHKIKKEESVTGKEEIELSFIVTQESSENM
jgi:hypothetical protein